MRIDVTAEDIAGGKKLDCNLCPIARAARRALNGLVSVTTSRIFHSRGVCDMPDEAQQFIDDFDSGRTVQPFSFELEVGE